MKKEIKLRGVEVFVEKNGRLPIRLSKVKREENPEELDYENSLGSWLNNKKFDNSDLTDDQRERLEELLPEDKKKTSSEVLEEFEEFVLKYNKMPSKSATKRKKGLEEDLKHESRLGQWLGANKKKNFINLTEEERIKVRLLIRNCKSQETVKSSDKNLR